MVLDVPAQHGMEIQEDQLAFFEGFHGRGEQAQAHQVLQVNGRLLLVIQDVSSELGREGCLEEADRVKDAALFGGEAPDAVVHAGVEGSLALGIFQAGRRGLFGNFELLFALLEEGGQVGGSLGKAARQQANTERVALDSLAKDQAVGTWSKVFTVGGQQGEEEIGSGTRLEASKLYHLAFAPVRWRSHARGQKNC